MASKGREDPLWHRFAAGGLGDMTATLFSHPADVLKVRLQLIGQGKTQRTRLTAKQMFGTARNLAATEGVRNGLYAGLSAGLLRQASFSSLRHGLYGVFERKLLVDADAATPVGRLCCALSAGCIAAVVANPTDVVLVRMQGDGAQPQNAQRNYRHVLDGLTRIVRAEGACSLWLGCSPNVLRAALVTGSQIATFEEAKAAIRRAGVPDGVGSDLACAMVSATVACIATTPVDTVKTRIMNMRQHNGPQYRGPLDCVLQTARSEGLFAFFQALPATFLRLWPHTVVLWMAQGRIREMMRGSMLPWEGGTTVGPNWAKMGLEFFPSLFATR